MLEVTLNFPSNASANQFATAWSRATLEGHIVSAVKEDGSVSVKVYNVDENRKAFIESYINRENSKR